MNKFDAGRWIRLSLISLLIIAGLGVLMRYKIAFDFPFLSQKNIQNAHSHFAFVGWVTQTIYVLMIRFLVNHVLSIKISKYKSLLWMNLTCSYSMLISFFISGYSTFSIVLSTLSIVLNAVFAYNFFKDIRALNGYHPSVPWFKSAIWFNLISSIGTFYLAYIIASKNFNENWYLASVYFYLHFQYNGFFIFSCFGFFVEWLRNVYPGYKYHRIIFILFFAACIPAYFLSILWADLPNWLYILVVLAAILQVVAWGVFLTDIAKVIKVSKDLPKVIIRMLLFVAVAFTIKLLLQLGSTIPELSKLAFGFRPVVIAYLHLVLLGVISAFLLTYFVVAKLMLMTKKVITALTVFFVGILLNEVVLAIQGGASFGYMPIKYINEILFVVAIVLFFGAILLVMSKTRVKEDENLPQD